MKHAVEPGEHFFWDLRHPLSIPPIRPGAESCSDHRAKYLLLGRGYASMVYNTTRYMNDEAFTSLHPPSVRREGDRSTADFDTWMPDITVFRELFGFSQ